MSSSPKLNAKKRTLTGRKVKNLRRQNLLPANIYGKDVKSLAVELPEKEFTAVFKTAGETKIVELSVDKEAKSRSVLIANVQRHPVSDVFLHVDFRQVDLTKKVVVAVPLELTGEAPAVIKGGVLVKLINELEVEALPNDLPDKISVDISHLEEIGQSISLQEVIIDTAKLKLMAEKLDELVVKIEAPAKEEEPAPVPAEAAPVEGEAAKVEEKPAEEAKKAEPATKPQKEDQGKTPAANKA